MSPLIKSNADIVLQFAAGGMMFVCAALMSEREVAGSNAELSASL